MRSVNIIDAETNLSRLVEAIESGAEQEVIITRAGKPAARIVALATTQPIELDPPLQALAEFNAGNEDIIELFENSKIFPDDMLSEAESNELYAVKGLK
jgi:antitoxin (DNA-binding transcriptional repressor) of toxin-antitoxin stability system